MGWSVVRKLGAAIALALVAILAYLCLWPVPAEPASPFPIT